MKFAEVLSPRRPTHEILLFQEKSRRNPIVLIEISYAFLESDLPLGKINRPLKCFGAEMNFLSRNVNGGKKATNVFATGIRI